MVVCAPNVHRMYMVRVCVCGSLVSGMECGWRRSWVCGFVGLWVCDVGMLYDICVVRVLCECVKVVVENGVLVKLSCACVAQW